MPLDVQTLGQKTAISLMKEMRFLGKLKNDSNLNDFLDIPSRDKLGFQVIKGMDAAKSETSKGNFGAELAGLRFCVADGEVERVNMMDIDHTIPFKYINIKQEALLNYLNDPNNAGFTEGFLKATTTIDSKTINISDYFGRNTTNNTVQGTKRFFKLCYNDIDNLLLICHACNIQKSAGDSLEWFRKQEPFLGERFVKAVNEAGGLYEGIIVKKICKATSDSSDIVKIGEFYCRLHDGEGKGLGEFVNEWFENENPGYSKGVVSAYSNIWLQLKEIWELQLKTKVADDKANKAAKLAANKLTAMLDSHIKTVESYYSLPTTQRVKETSEGSSSKSHSTSDGSCDKKVRIQLIDNNIKKTLFYMHNVKTIISFLVSKKDTSLQVTQIHDFFLKFNVQGHTLEEQRKIFKETCNLLSQMSQKTPTIEEMHSIISHAVEEVNPMFQKLKEVTEEKNIAEARAREEGEKRIILEEKLASMQKQLAELTLTQMHQAAADERTGKRILDTREKDDPTSNDMPSTKRRSPSLTP